MRSVVITCDGCGASTSEAMRPDGWACLHIHIFDGEGNSKPSGTTDRCARCMMAFLSPLEPERVTLTEEQIANAMTARQCTECWQAGGHTAECSKGKRGTAAALRREKQTGLCSWCGVPLAYQHEPTCTRHIATKSTSAG
jgi:hypothetical protein